MTASIEFFPVGDGDMTLIRLATGRTILIDINIRNDADNDNKEDYPDVAKMLKDRLPRDASNENRPYVDAFILTHPDQDHCGGLRTHFHLGAPSAWKKPEDGEPETIVIHEMWSSPLTFRRMKSADGKLVADAKAWQKEAKRRVALAKQGDGRANDPGNRVKIIGQDRDHKTDGIEHLVVKVGERVIEVCGEEDASFSALLLSPKLVTKKEADELSGKNNSSIVMQLSISPYQDKMEDKSVTKFLTGGDAEVDIWKRVWKRNQETPENLSYQVLQTPHHCSLGVLSNDNYSDQPGKKGKGEECEIDEEANLALSQAQNGAYIIASSKQPEKNTGKNLAKREYERIAGKAEGEFLCTMKDSPDQPLMLEITEDGPKPPRKKSAIAAPPPKTQKGRTERGYA
ncbi:MAG: metallohydrolase [Alloalcanivorax sp.]